MILQCPACKTRYVVPDNAIGATGRSVRCASCGHKWFQPPGLTMEIEPEPPLPAQPVEPETARADAGPGLAEPVVPEADTAETMAGEPHRQSWAARDIDELPPPPLAVGRYGDRPRRNPAKLWTIAALAFALIVAGGVGALAAFGVPAWAQDAFAFALPDEPDLVIELPVEAQVHRTTENGTIYFHANGFIVNPTDRAQRVPPIKAELRDADGGIVYEWIIPAPVASLPPGERVGFSEARADIPRRAVLLTASWANPR